MFDCNLNMFRHQIKMCMFTCPITLLLSPLSMRPNLSICVDKRSTVYKKWYFEVAIDKQEAGTSRPVHFRVGWATSAGFRTHLRGGEGWGNPGVGDDLYSFGFDGMNLWTG